MQSTRSNRLLLSLTRRFLHIRTAAQATYTDAFHEYEGFYLSHHQKSSVLMVAKLPGNANYSENSKEIMCQIFAPQTGLQKNHISLFKLKNEYLKVAFVEAKAIWTERYDASVNTCSHEYDYGNCSVGINCNEGLRQRKYHILNGAVLSVLDRIEHILETSGSNCKIQLIRMKTVTDQVHMGILIPKSCFESLCEDLRSDSENSAVFSY